MARQEMRKARYSVMANGSNHDPVNLNHVQGYEPARGIRTGSADSIRASGQMFRINRPDIELQPILSKHANQPLP